MTDFLAESNALSLPATPKNRTGGDEWLYEVFRCGFVHGYPAGKVRWRRSRSTNYWSYRNGWLTLNIDELVRGFQRGIKEFVKLAQSDADLQSRFIDYIKAE